MDTNVSHGVSYCEAVVFHGSRNPDSSNFGPDEYCENEVAEGSAYCGEHTAPEEPDYEPNYDGLDDDYYAYADDTYYEG